MQQYESEYEEIGLQKSSRINLSALQVIEQGHAILKLPIRLFWFNLSNMLQLDFIRKPVLPPYPFLLQLILLLLLHL